MFAYRPIPELDDPGWAFGTIKGAPAALAPVVSSKVTQKTPLEMILSSLAEVEELPSWQTALELNNGCWQIKSEFKGSEEHTLHEASISALEQAFKLAEEAKGGLSDQFVTELCTTMSK